MDHLTTLDDWSSTVSDLSPAQTPQWAAELDLHANPSSPLPADLVPRAELAGPAPVVFGAHPTGIPVQWDIGGAPGAVGDWGATLDPHYPLEDHSWYPGMLDQAIFRDRPVTAASTGGSVGRPTTPQPYAYDYPAVSDLEVRDALMAAGAGA